MLKELRLVALGAVAAAICAIDKINHKKEKRMTDTGNVVQEVQEKTPTQSNMIEGVLVVGTEMLHHKMLHLLSIIIGKEDDHGVSSITFAEDYPKMIVEVDGDTIEENVLGRFHADARAMVVNMVCHFELALERIKSGESKLNLWAYIWVQLIRTLYHEINHAHKYHDADRIYDVEEDDSFDTEAEEYALAMLIDLAKEHDIEPPSIDEEPFFAATLGKYLMELPEVDEDWARNQIHMFENGLVYFDPADTEKGRDAIALTSIREYCRMLADDGDEAWAQPVATMPNAPVQQHDTAIAPEPVVGFQGADPSLFSDSAPEDFGDGDENAASMPAVETVFPMGTTKAATIPSMVMPAANIMPSAPTPTPSGTVGLGNVLTGQQSVAQPIQQVAPHNLSVEEMTACLQAVLVKLYVHIFNKCGFAPGQDHGFVNAGAVTEPVYIGDIPNAEKLFLRMDTVDAQGNTVRGADIWKPAAAENRPAATIRGRVFKDGQLPGYHLYLNINGMLEKRSFLPQNPNKVHGQGHPKAGQLTDWAAKARAGHCIAMLLQDNVGVRVKIATAPGGMTEYELDPFAGR